ncbi:MAG: S46 family peptidase [Bacteroidota bacterium]
MLNTRSIVASMVLLVAISLTALAQGTTTTTAPDPFDYGKMWTFEHAPLDYFEKTYGFRPGEEWLDDTRMSAIRFATYCSGSFISPDGLILTNHHCSREEVLKVMQEGEDFDANGFYAPERGKERRVPGLFIKQLVQLVDVTKEVKKFTAKATSDEQFNLFQDSILTTLVKEYEGKKDWAGLEVEPVVYYSGGQYSLYGYKRYDDIRLVLIPEEIIGFFGGDPDNFTYPRYNLDFTIWRAYEDGEPVNTADHYFKVNPAGPKLDRPIFAVSNPASTERYRTYAQLEFDRDARYNVLLDWLSNRVEILEGQQAENYSPQVQEQIFNLSNGIKAYEGILKGLDDQHLMGRKKAIEDYVRQQSGALKNGNDYWKQLEEAYAPLEDWGPELTILSGSGYNGKAMQTAHYLARYMEMLDSEASEEDLAAIKGQITSIAAGIKKPVQVAYLTKVLEEAVKHADEKDTYIKELLGMRSPAVAAKAMITTTAFSSDDGMASFFALSAEEMKSSDEPMVKLVETLVKAYQEGSQKFRASTATRTALEEKISNEVFKVYGLSIPPDATFTLRLADGMVKQYPYNGTIAPYKTTFYGLYDRYFSNDGNYPWSLPERWLNPVQELLRSPLNFIATTDSIGGSSGSPMVNENGELVGLLFDGNIESLPGNFIYDTALNRSVAVHAGGIVAALKYVYQADSILKEIGVE